LHLLSDMCDLSICSVIMLLSDMSGRCPLYRKYVKFSFHYAVRISFNEALRFGSKFQYILTNTLKISFPTLGHTSSLVHQFLKSLSLT
jgi:hypothetical protein